MKKIFSIILALVASTAIALAEPLTVGSDAPDFELKGSDGKTYKLSDFKGKKAVVIAWFPKAFTGGCTRECKAMAEQGDQIKKYDVAYFTASVDDAEQNRKFAESLSLDYPILSDPSKETARSFGMANRWTYYIDKNGKIAAVDMKVNTDNHGNDIAARLKDLGIAQKK